MTIRLRIILLAIVGTLCFSMLMISKSMEIHNEVTGLENRLSAIERASGATLLIHSLQKERGLSAGFLVRSNSTLLEKLTAQQQQTDSDMAVLETALATNPRTGQWIDEFRRKLVALRTDISNRITDWPNVRRFFTEAISHMLDDCATQILVEGGAHSQESMGIIELGATRENLGLIRATMNRVYTRKEALPSDLVDVARFLGAFQAHFHAFLRDLESDHQHEVMTRIGIDKVNSVIRQVENALTSSEKKDLQHSPSQWWDEVTGIIDTMKSVGDAISGELKQRVSSAMIERQADLTRYIIATIGLTMLMAGMTIFTLFRILSALSILLNALGSVINTQNFSIRIGSEPSNDEFGRISYSFNKLLDVTDTLIQKKDRIASIDELTGLFNRRSFREKSDMEFKRAARYSRHLCFIICDIDHFKSVNDTHGHAVGDDVLKRFAAVLMENIRTFDLVGRWGGEEFVILAVESDLEMGAALAEKLRMLLDGLSIPKVGKITCSFGVALWRGRDEEMDALCARADVALYQAKTEGRNRVVTA